MFASTKLAAVFSVLAAAAAAVSAAPAKVFEPSSGNVDVVFRPHITAPTAGAVWQTGSSQVITWDASNIPAENQNQTGLILLGYIQDGDVSEHLDIREYLVLPILHASIGMEAADLLIFGAYRAPPCCELPHHCRAGNCQRPRGGHP